MANVKVKFLQDYTVKDEEAKHYKKGSTSSLSQASAAHFISRGVAVLVATKAKKEPAAKKSEKGILKKAKDVITGNGSDK